MASAADPRTRAAALRRHRMREKLLEAVLELYQPATGGEPVIDDVVRTAGVSRGTFYKYYTSVSAAVADLGDRLAASLIADFEALFGNEEDAAVQAIGGVALVMIRAWHDPRWAGFTCRVDYVDFFSRRRLPDLMVRDCLATARDRGQIRFTSVDVAVDLIVGASIEARRRMIDKITDPPRYADEMIDRIFLGLGMDANTAATARETAWRYIQSGAPKLDWWKPGSAWHGSASALEAKP
jgi:AcrR family transcriptional regulator